MSQESFSPSSREYKKVEDLPKDEQANFKNVDGGFVKNTALENIAEVQSDEEYLMELPEDSGEKDERIKQWEQLLGTEEVAEIRGFVAALYEPIKKMIEPILANIKNDYYQLLIGDDASGRIPTLIVRKFINETNQRDGRANILTRFLAGSTVHESDRFYVMIDGHKKHVSDEERSNGSDKKIEKLKSYIQDMRNASSIDIHQVLIVTDYVNTGQGLFPLLETLSNNNISHTVCAVSVSPSREMFMGIASFEKARNTKLLSGYVGVEPKIFKKQFSGVSKYFSDLHATPIRKSLPDDEKKVVLAKMGIARDEANRVAERLITELLPPEAASTATM